MVLSTEGKCHRLLWIHPKWNLIAPGWKPKAKRQWPKLSLTDYASDQLPSQLLCSDPPLFQWNTWCSHYSLQRCKNLSFNKLQGLLVSDGNCSNVANVWLQVFTLNCTCQALVWHGSGPWLANLNFDIFPSYRISQNPNIQRMNYCWRLTDSLTLQTCIMK